MTKIDASKIREFRRYAYQTDFPRITIIKLCDAYDEAMKEIDELKSIESMNEYVNGLKEKIKMRDEIINNLLRNKKGE